MTTNTSSRHRATSAFYSFRNGIFALLMLWLGLLSRWKIPERVCKRNSCPFDIRDLMSHQSVRLWAPAGTKSCSSEFRVFKCCSPTSRRLWKQSEQSAVATGRLHRLTFGLSPSVDSSVLGVYLMWPASARMSHCGLHPWHAAGTKCFKCLATQ